MTFTTVKVTSALILSTIVGWILWDLVVAANTIRGDTESEVIRTFANRHPSFPFLVGIVMGHFFWNVTEPINPWLSRLVMPAVAGAVVCADYYGISGHMNPVIPFCLGFVTGHLTWPQMSRV